MKQVKVPVEQFDRVSGYFRPTFAMNRGKQEEQRERKRFDVKRLITNEAQEDLVLSHS